MYPAMRGHPVRVRVAWPDRVPAVSPWLWVALRALVVGGLYAGIYKLIAVETSFGTSIGATFWPASGVTVSALVLRDRREWPFYLIAVYVADFAMDITCGGYRPEVAVGVALANCMEPLLAATLLRRWCNARPDLSRLRDLGLFYAAAAGCGPLLSAVISACWMALSGAGAVWPFLGRWYVGDALGVVVVAPLILSLPGTRPGWACRWSRCWPGAALLLVVGVALPWRFAAHDGLPFIVIPALMVVGIRTGTRVAATVMFIVGTLVEIVTAVGAGPFSGGGSFSGLLAAQMYLVACSVTALMTAALMTGLVSRDEMALHDSLTGLANRRLLMDRLTVACAHLQRAGAGALGLMFIDLDGFKSINDRYGHSAGDHVLVQTARRLQSVVRDQDTVARIGGDEFVILVDHVDDDAGLEGLADRVMQAVAAPIADREPMMQITASVGYTLAHDADASQEALLGRADSAMYAAKRARAVV
jgi:diguanylate cyclase (GGDEF)-like protein